MKSLYSPLRVVVAACFLASCSPKENTTTLAADSTGMAPIEQYDLASMPQNFAAFLGNFPIKPLPARFPSDDGYSEGELVAIDRGLVKEFLSVYDFEQDQNRLYYLASLKLHPDLYSVLLYYVGSMGAPSYMLANFTEKGTLLSTRTVAYSEAGGGMASWSTAVFDKNGALTITDSEEGSGTKEEYLFAYQVTPAGAILPTGIPPELIDRFHNAVLKKGEYMVAPVYGYVEVQLNSISFSLSKQGDSTLLSPYSFFETNANGLHELIVDSYAKTSLGHRFTFKEIDYSHDLYDALTHITLNSAKSSPGVYQLVFTPAGSDYAVVTAAKPEFVIADTKLSAYKTRKLPFIDGEYGISTFGGLIRLRLETSQVDEIGDWAKENGYIYRKDVETGDPQQTVYHSVFERNEQVVVQAVTDSRSRNLVEMILYSPRFKTDGGIGVGSTLGELLYAHENVSAICGQNSVIISIADYNHAYFNISFIAGAPDSDVDLETLDPELKIERIDFRLD